MPRSTASPVLKAKPLRPSRLRYVARPWTLVAAFGSWHSPRLLDRCLRCRRTAGPGRWRRWRVPRPSPMSPAAITPATRTCGTAGRSTGGTARAMSGRSTTARSTRHDQDVQASITFTPRAERVMRDFDLKVEFGISAGANGGIHYRSRLLMAPRKGSIANPLGTPMPPITPFGRGMASRRSWPAWRREPGSAVAHPRTPRRDFRTRGR